MSTVGYKPVEKFLRHPQNIITEIYLKTVLSYTRMFESGMIN